MTILIHQIVIGGRAPTVNRRCISSWAELRPHFELRVWQNQDIRAFVGSAQPLVRELLTRARNFGQAGDILRYAILYQFGGIYADWDIYLLDPQQFAERFSAFGQKGALFLRDSKTSDPDFNAIIASSFVYSEPKRHLLLSFLERIGENYNEDLSSVHITGPQALTRFLLDAGWNLDGPEFVELEQFFRHRFDIVMAQSNKRRFLENEIRTPGTAPLLNLWTNCWIEKSWIRRLRGVPILGARLPDSFTASMKYILSE